MRLNDPIWPVNSSERILFGLARYNSAGSAAFNPNKAIEDENRSSVLLTFNYIPDLSNSPAIRMD